MQLNLRINGPFPSWFRVNLAGTYTGRWSRCCSPARAGGTWSWRRGSKLSRLKQDFYSLQLEQILKVKSVSAVAICVCNFVQSWRKNPDLLSDDYKVVKQFENINFWKTGIFFGKLCIHRLCIVLYCYLLKGLCTAKMKIYIF